ncbi:MAG: hypothetical protein ACTHMA_12230 [Thermomicrobiales bacterium]
MSTARKAIDISDNPELLRLVEEMNAAEEPLLLRRGDTALALLTPVKRPRARKRKREHTDADRAAFRAAAGGWKGLVDTEAFIRDVYESRRISSRPPVKLDIPD